VWDANPPNGRNPIFNGRRQPSCGGTSRMTRECQVRICEGLGVKFPGPTRQKPALPRRSIAVRFRPNKQTPTARAQCDAMCRYCCKSPKLSGANFLAVMWKTRPATSGTFARISRPVHSRAVFISARPDHSQRTRIAQCKAGLSAMFNVAYGAIAPPRQCVPLHNPPGGPVCCPRPLPKAGCQRGRSRLQ
jgi:hypothetical protein